MSCKIETKDGVTSFTCYRGHMKHVKLVLKDKQGNEWFCDLKKDIFALRGDNIGIEVYDKDNHRKKFLKSYLELIKEM